MSMVSFKKGLLANLPATKTPGAFYVTTDERAIYLDVNAESRIRLGDFQEFASVTELTKNANPNTTALYYVTDINCLAKWNGSEYIQINRDTGMTSVEVTGEGNALTAAVYDATGRKLTLTKGATYMTAADVDGKISTAVGTLGNDAEGNAYANVKAYVDAKTSGIATDTALTALTTRVSTAEGEIDVLQAAIGVDGSVTKAIADAKKAGTDAATAAATAQATAESKTTMAEVEAKGYATKTEAQGYADAKDATITAAKAAADAAQSDVDALETLVGALPEGATAKTVVAYVDEKVQAGAYDDTNVKADIAKNATAIAGVKEDVDAFLNAAAVGDAAVDTLKEIQEYITTHGTAADEMVKNIAANKKAIEDEAATARAAETANATGVTEAKTAAKTAQSGVDAIKADYLKAADKTTLQGNIDAVSSRVKTIEDKNVSDGATKVEKSDTNGNIKIDGVETVVYTHPEKHAIADVDGLQAALDAKATGEALTEEINRATAAEQANTTEIAKKANKATTLAGYGITDAYKKTETYTQTEVNSMLTWGEF